MSLLTAREIASRLSVPLYTLNYALSEYGPEPDSRVGLTRLWRERSIPAIKRSLAKTAKRSTKPERRQQAEAAR